MLWLLTSLILAGCGLACETTVPVSNKKRVLTENTKIIHNY